jgi:hypothetical protein
VAVSALHDTKINESADQLRTELSVVATRSTLYRVTVGYATPQGAVALANAVASEGASLYQQLAGGAANSVLPGLDQDRAKYRDQYLAAAQALANFNSAHPLPLAGTAGDPAIEAPRLQLQTDEQAARNAYVQLQQAAAQARVNQISAAHDFGATVVDQAIAHSQTTSHLLRAGFIGAVGLILGLALVVVWEYKRPTAVADAAEVEREVDLGPPPDEAGEDWVANRVAHPDPEEMPPPAADEVPPPPPYLDGADGHKELAAPGGNSHRQTKQRVFRK